MLLDIIAIIGFSTILEPLWGIKEFLVSDLQFFSIHALYKLVLRLIWKESKPPDLGGNRTHNLHIPDVIALPVALQNHALGSKVVGSWVFVYKCFLVPYGESRR